MMKQVSSLFIVLVIGFMPGILFPGDISFTKIGEWGTGAYYDVYIQGHYIYCAAGGAGLDILDISDPSLPKKIGNHDTPGIANALYVDGHYVFTADWEGGLQIFDVSQPSSPVLSGSYDSPGYVGNVYVKGNYAFVACYDSGLHIVDVSVPSKPIPIGIYDTPGEARGVVVVGDYAYVADGNKGLQIIDVKVPSNPVSVGDYDTPGYSRRVVVMGDYSYIADNDGGLQILDITDPSTPVLAGSVSTYNMAKDVFINGNYAYVAADEGGLKVIDISEPSDPEVIGKVNTPGSALGMHISDKIAYVADYNYGLQLLDVSDPSSPTGIGSFDNSLVSATSIDIKGNYAYLLDYHGELNILNISNPHSPTRVGQVGAGSKGFSVITRGDYAYVVGGGLTIIDVSQPSSPTIEGHGLTGCNAVSLAISGNYAYTGGFFFTSLFSIIDISNPSNPMKVGGFSNNHFSTYMVDVVGNYAYLSYYGGMEVIDISNPFSTHLVGTFSFPVDRFVGAPIHVMDNYAYAAVFDSNLLVIDVSDPSRPTLVGSGEGLDSPQDIFVIDGYAYVAEADKGLLVFDVTNPSAPTLVGSYDTPGNARSALVKGNYAYVADGDNGKLIILEIDKSSTSPRIKLDRTQLNFASDKSGAATPVQSLFITNSGGGSLDWSAAPNRKWLSCSLASGTNSGEILVSINTTGLIPGTYQGTIIISDANASNSPQTVEVTLMVYGPGQTSEPFGMVATPVDGAAVSGSIPVTGWVLDDIGVQGVVIFREMGKNLVFIGEGVLVEGARPDVEQAYPGYPMNYQAGWGYMMLTNFLPNEGNGTFKIHAIATDLEGNQVTLGTTTITCDNTNTFKPFGTIDTPLQGGTASGNNYINWGWALTPQPNTIPTDGFTITVWVDGVPLGHPVYNRYRQDIAALFPDYNNSNGAGGYFYLDTSQYKNGVHTISWSVSDDAGNTDGIGSRYFSIQNTAHSAKRTTQSIERTAQSAWRKAQRAPDISKIPLDYTQPLRVKKGYNPEIEPQILYPGEDDVVNIRIREMERVEICLSEETTGLAPLSNGNNLTNRHWTGFQVIGSRLRPLPIGSFLDRERGVFCWHPGAGFMGKYRFVFIARDQLGNKTKNMVEITIGPKFPGFDEKNENKNDPPINRN